MVEVKVNRRGAERIRSGHPWIYRSDIVDAGGAEPGQPVRVVDPRGQFLGAAHYSSTSQIALRLLSPKQIPIDAAFFQNRILAAKAHRDRLVRDTQAYRLVHAEADFLPGLIIVRYHDCLVLSALSQGMDAATPDIVSALTGLYQPRAIVARNDAHARKLESLPQENKILHGELPGPVEVAINGLVFHADLLEGQKTGIFLDQRENYLAASRHAHGHALDCFTSTGGFGLHLAQHCETVEAVDSSVHAIASATRNRDANSISNITYRQADVFELLAGYAHARRRFDVVVLDPPAFAKSRATVESGLRGYGEINYRALQLLQPGGVLITCSCSHHVSEADLLQAIAQASLDAGRTVRVLERRTQSNDHPILLTVPETHYLKCLILEVASVPSHVRIDNRSLRSRLGNRC